MFFSCSYKDRLEFSRRYWRVGQVDVHQADEDHPRSWLSGRGEEDLHQAGLPEHLHGDAVHDQGHGPAQDPVRGLVLYGMSTTKQTEDSKENNIHGKCLK